MIAHVLETGKDIVSWSENPSGGSGRPGDGRVGSVRTTCVAVQREQGRHRDRFGSCSVRTISIPLCRAEGATEFCISRVSELT
jgi:hypothetical protein